MYLALSRTVYGGFWARQICRLLHRWHDLETSAFFRIESLPVDVWVALRAFQRSRHDPAVQDNRNVSGIVRRKDQATLVRDFDAAV